MTSPKKSPKKTQTTKKTKVGGKKNESKIVRIARSEQKPDSMKEINALYADWSGL